ncbi:helicase HerA-like C-terminal domain-containing protein [Taklimakanibacter lacteus]|uniref:helicase HerA-like C-terminal domain-containing protein n=1 Tax=Taklimakanibacter lacteus TaxID=2268456 RepID=UPI000E667AF2
MADNTIFLGKAGKREELFLPMANRHGLVTGATGTGKTVTLQIMAEGFCQAGVPVFAADVKGDLSGISQEGTPQDFLIERAKKVGFDDYGFAATPTIFWDLFGEQGHPIRTTISEMGPLLLSRLMGLTDAQEGALNIAFKIADEEGLALLDLKDLRALLSDLAARGKELRTDYGNLNAMTIGSIQRRLVVIEEQGGDKFFGEPALDIKDLMRTTRDGRGYMNILAADKLMSSPQLYATFLLWLLSELFEELPEVGDPDKPKLVFFFDEAHLLFTDAPAGLLQKIEQTVKLIRSKGVGVYFVTQNPLDVPESVLAQMGNRVQHALRAYTPREQKAVKTAADTFRPNPKFKTDKAITELGKGEALVSVLDLKGVPTMVERTLIRPPESRLGPITPQEREKLIKSSPVYGQYDEAEDRESAYEKLIRRANERAAAQEKAAAEKQAAREARAPPRQRESATDRFIKNVAGSVGRQLGSMVVRSLVRGILGGFTRR